MSWQTVGNMMCAVLLTWLVLEWLALVVIAVVVVARRFVRRRVVPLSKEEGDEVFRYTVRLDGPEGRLGEELKGMTFDVKEVVMGQ